MASREMRLAMLGQLLEANGTKMGRSELAVQGINDWFLEQVEPDPENPGYLLTSWYSVVHDLALLLGEVMIERHPNLHWELFVWGRSNVAYHRHVIMGMKAEDPKLHTNIDVEGMLTAYGHQIVAHRGSIARVGTVIVRGVSVNVDEIAEPFRARTPPTAIFTQWLQNAADRA